MKILFIGDIVGRGGREAVRELLPRIQREEGIDLSVANGENAAGGTGITPKIMNQLFFCGVDIITSGNHLWDKKEIIPTIDKERRLLRPANYPPGVPGLGSTVAETASGLRIGIINLSGRVFMPALDCPFRTAEREIEKLRKKTQLILVDIHAEATSEKIAMGWFLDGKVSAVVGTHTHVQTADERIMPQGTAYITDVGMTGSAESVIGVKTDLILRRFLTQLPVRFEPAEEDIYLSAVVLDLNPSTGKANSIERVRMRWEGGG
ncbi:MAG: TIGR00282 family metallophosphoesterase [Nitrospirae bacterium]|nr:TIGR00282 family metallophosphoesterase [Nitrospirota bacterium]